MASETNYPLPRPGDTCWRIEQAGRAAVIVDAEDYFRICRSAMMAAEKRIMLIGWDFDSRIRLGEPDEASGAPERVGEFISWLVDRKPGLDVYLLRWDLGALKILFRGTTILRFIRWMWHRRIHTKLDHVHPTGASHHQKIVVIDDCFAFCGGIDMTDERWDTRGHLDDDPQRRGASGKPYKPWHDATTALEGPVAAALGEHGRTRWKAAGGKEIQPVTGVCATWPDELAAQFTNVAVAISRTAPEMPGQDEIIEIERLYLDQIARAQRFIYAESQYFASRKIAVAIAKRLDEADGPEIVIVNPLTAQGWLEPIAMDSARARLMQALIVRDVHKKLRVYHPFTAGGAAIYVHAKILIVDDAIIRVGSSNMNNRSLRLDTECDVTIDARLPGNAGAEAEIEKIRAGLIGEHLACDPAEVSRTFAETESLIKTIERLRGDGKTLRPYEVPDLTKVESWLADHEVLDPEGPEEMFEAPGKRGLFRGLHRPAWMHRRGRTPA
jgi:phosphatidylserine/phosphatidylglycerophosphate/cardiolipin synthase-like enzyme